LSAALLERKRAHYVVERAPRDDCDIDLAELSAVLIEGGGGATARGGSEPGWRVWRVDRCR
jgi:hypothetical protein